MCETTVNNNANGCVRPDDAMREATTGWPSQQASNREAVILTAVYYSEPDASLDDEVLAEIVRHGGEEVCSSGCLCCDRREIRAIFSDRTRALDAAEVLRAIWDAEIEVRPFGETGE